MYYYAKFGRFRSDGVRVHGVPKHWIPGLTLAPSPWDTHAWCCNSLIAVEGRWKMQHWKMAQQIGQLKKLQFRAKSRLSLTAFGAPFSSRGFSAARVDAFWRMRNKIWLRLTTSERINALSMFVCCAEWAVFAGIQFRRSTTGTAHAESAVSAVIEFRWSTAHAESAVFAVFQFRRSTRTAHAESAVSAVIEFRWSTQ